MFHVNRVWVSASQPRDGPVPILPENDVVFDVQPVIPWSAGENARLAQFRLTGGDSVFSLAPWRVAQGPANAEDLHVPQLASGETYCLWARSEIQGS